MADIPNEEQAVELLQQLGLKEYEAKSFVALTRRDSGTAKDISEMSEVPRTRVYDAIRVLESKGLVETQHSNPQRFRAAPIDEAVGTLRTEYERRVDSLRQTLQGLEQVPQEDETQMAHEVWALSGDRGITSRLEQLIVEADEEIMLVLGHESVLTETLVEQLQTAHERGVKVIIGAVSEALRRRASEQLPDVKIFLSGLEWLSHSQLSGDDTEISRLLLVDREAILVSSFTKGENTNRQNEHAVYGQGFDNGLVAIVRRLMATGLLSIEDPGQSDA